MSDLRRRIEALESAVPQEIVLTLKNGSTFHHPGPAMDFYMEGMAQIQKGRGPLLKALLSTVSATGCAGLWEVLVVVAVGPVECGGRPTPPPKRMGV